MTTEYKQKTTLTIEELSNFPGTITWWRHALFPQYAYTDGIQYLAQKASAYWLFELIFSFQTQDIIKNDEDLKEFQLWNLRVIEQDIGILTCERDTDDIVMTWYLPSIDFPLTHLALYFENTILCLPSER